MWTGNLTQEDRIKINSRVIGNEESKGIELPKSFEEGCDVCYACPTNKERNAITAGIFREHIKREHPGIESKKNPPDHTIMVEAKNESSIPKKKNHQTLPIKINEMMRHRILTTCGDADVMVGTKHIDPLLCLYVGGYFMCIDNKHLSEGRGNGTLCRVIKMRLKETPKITAMNWEGRKVNTVNISEVHWVKLEH